MLTKAAKFSICALLVLAGCEPPAPADTAESEGTGTTGADTATGPSESGEVAPQDELTGQTRPSTALGWMPPNPGVLARFDMQAFLDMLSGDGAWFPDTDSAQRNLSHYLDDLGRSDTVMGALGESLELSQLRDFALGVWIHDQSVVLVMNPQVVTDPPARGGPPREMGDSGLQIAHRGQYVIVGIGSAFTRALTLEDIDSYADPSQVWPGGWERMPADPVLSVAIENFGLASAPFREQLALARQFNMDRVAITLAQDAAVVFEATSDETTRVLRTVGSAQVLGDRLATEISQQLPESLSGWGAYSSVLLDTAWSQMTLVETSDGFRSTLSSGACGQPGQNLLVAFLVGKLIGEVVAADLITTPYAQREATMASTCGPIPGPAPSLPLDLLTLAAPEGDAGWALALIDYAAALRSLTPNGLGMLPFAIPVARLRETVGETPLGLPSYEAEGRAAVWWSRAPTPPVAIAAGSGALPDVDDNGEAPAGSGAPPAGSGEAPVTVGPRFALQFPTATADLLPAFGPPYERVVDGPDSRIQAQGFVRAETVNPLVQQLQEQFLGDGEGQTAALLFDRQGAVDFAAWAGLTAELAPFVEHLEGGAVVLDGEWHPTVGLIMQDLDGVALDPAVFESAVRAVIERQELFDSFDGVGAALVSMAFPAAIDQVSAQIIENEDGPTLIQMTFGSSGHWVAIGTVGWLAQRLAEDEEVHAQVAPPVTVNLLGGGEATGEAAGDGTGAAVGSGDVPAGTGGVPAAGSGDVPNIVEPTEASGEAPE